VAFVHLVRQLREWDFGLIDCQIASAHLATLGAHTIPRSRFLALLRQLTPLPGKPGSWAGEGAI